MQSALASWDTTFFGDSGDPASDPDAVEEAMVAYMVREQALRGTPWPQAARHMLGLRNGQPGARRWRQVWSDHRLRGQAPEEVARLARQARLGTVEPADAAAAT